GSRAPAPAPARRPPRRTPATSRGPPRAAARRSAAPAVPASPAREPASSPVSLPAPPPQAAGSRGATAHSRAPIGEGRDHGRDLLGVGRGQRVGGGVDPLELRLRDV